jgi:protocadherin Fat 1/2/3
MYAMFSNCSLYPSTGASSFSVLSTGVIEVAGSLDFETKTTYTLTIKATDTAGLFDTATVIISVTDVNESPVFTSAPYSATVAENDSGASVVTASATDVDAGINSTFDFDNF